MKNLFFAAAVAALACAGCTAEDDPVTPTPPHEIPVNFSTSISKISRATPITGTAFAADAEIAVYGTETKGDVVTPEWMNYVKLTQTDGDWTYDSPKNFKIGYKYSFVAYAPYSAALDMQTLTAVPYLVGDMTAQKDLLIVPSVKKDYSTTAPKSGDQVGLVFKHALSQVMFSAVTSADYAASYEVKITNIELKGLVSSGKLDFTSDSGSWTLDAAIADYSQSVSASVGALSNGETATSLKSDDGVLMLIPQSPAGKQLILTLAVTAKAGGDATIAGNAKNITVKFPADDPAWAAGHAYTYKITLNLDETLGWSAGFSTPTITEWVTNDPERPITNN